MSVRLRIIAAMKQIAEEQQVKLPPLNDELSLHETGFDSLAFAILVARLVSIRLPSRKTRRSR
jgi:hypothetical protein